MASNCVDYEFVEELQDELMCFICMKVLNEPQMVNCCEKKICKSCLTKWMTRNKSCPHCRSTDFSYILLQGLSRRLSKLKVYCANKNYGCKFTLMVSEYKHHLSTDNVQGCLFTKLPCPNKCDVQDIFRGDLDNHCKEECPRRIIKCLYCKIEGEYRVISGEHIDTCPLYPITCPKACGDQIVRKDLTVHQDICPLESVACSFSDIGCNVKVLRQDLDKHIQSSMLQHMKDMATSYSTTKTQLMELKQEHEVLKKNNKVLKEDHEVLKEDHEVLKKNHEVLKKNHEVLKEDYEVLKEDYEALKEDNKVLKEDYEVLKEDHEVLKKNHEVSKEDYEALKEDNKVLKEDHEALKKNHEVLKKNHEVLKKDHEVLKALKENNKVLKKDYEVLKEDFESLKRSVW